MFSESEHTVGLFWFSCAEVFLIRVEQNLEGQDLALCEGKWRDNGMN